LSGNKKKGTKKRGEHHEIFFIFNDLTKNEHEIMEIFYENKD